MAKLPQATTFGGIELIDLAKKKICIVHGRADYDAMLKAGYKNVIFVRAGMTLLDLNLAISDAMDVLETMDEVYLGVFTPRYADEIARRLTTSLVRRIKWTEPYLAPSALMFGVPALNLSALGRKEIARCIAEAKVEPVIGIYEPNDYRDRVIDVYEHGNPPGYSLGWEGLRTEYGKDLYTVKEGTLNLVTGNYGSGKSEFVENMEVIMAVNEGWNFLVFTAEAPPEQAIANIAEKFIGEPFNSGYVQRMDRPTLDVSLDWVHDHFTFFDTSEMNFSLDDIIKHAEIAVKRKGIRGLIIDPWNNVLHSNTKAMREDLYLGECLRKLNVLKRKHGLWITCVAHPITMRRDKDGKFPVPTIRDVSGGITWANMTDLGMCVDYDRSDENSLVHIYVQKVKFKNLGKLGVGHLRFDLPTGRYYDAENELGNIVNADPVLANVKEKTFAKFIAKA